jgi:hypothetical protein
VCQQQGFVLAQHYFIPCHKSGAAGGFWFQVQQDEFNQRCVEYCFEAA